MFNLFDVQQGCDSLGEKARDATPREIRAYLEFLAARDGITIPVGAQFNARGITVGAAFDRNGRMLSGTVILEMPGYGVPQIVTCEILDDDGDVVRKFPLPADKRGKLPMTAKQVQDWTGLAPVKAKRDKAAPVAPIAVAAPAPVEAQEPVAVEPIAVDAPERAAAPWPQDYVTGPEAAGRRARLDGEERAVPSWCSGPAHMAWIKGWEFADAYLSSTPEMPASEPQDAQEALDPIACTHSEPDALHGAEIDAPEPLSEAYTLPATPTADASDPIAAIEARLAELERTVAALSMESEAVQSAADYSAIIPAPTAEKRTPAHERAIRRAWADRRRARLALSIADDHLRMREKVQAHMLEVSRDLETSRDQAATYRENAEEARRALDIMADTAARHLDRRRRTTARARRMIAAARAEAKGQRQAAAGARFELAKLKRDLADPSQPERASDIARLVQERDAARNANAALQARVLRAEQARDGLAGKFEEMISRLARAEAAVRAGLKVA